MPVLTGEYYRKIREIREIRRSMVWEVLDIAPWTVLVDQEEDGVRCLLTRGPSNLCVYLGVPFDHPLAGFNYHQIPLKCHGGLTHSCFGGEGCFPEGFYWYGWDYGHAGDAAAYYYNPDGTLLRPNLIGKEWTVEETKEEMLSVARYQFKPLMELAEAIAGKRPLLVKQTHEDKGRKIRA